MDKQMENRPLKVEKIGGTSMADTKAVLNNVLLRSKAPEELYNRIVVVSAYAGVTDKLLEQKKTGEPGVYALFASAETGASWEKALDRVAEEMLTLNQKIFGDCADRRTADSFVRERVEGIRSCLIDLRRLCSYGHFHLDEHMLTVREMLSALGEAHSANNTALLLRQHGVNACFIDMTGWRDETQPTLDERIQSSLGAVDLSSELPIVTGYAHCREGLMRNFDRGYTEVTFSRIAVLLQASEAIIHKEFHLSSADPKIVGVEKVQKIGKTNYDVADQLSNMGMEAVHPRAAKGLRQAGIPLRVKNTFDPTDAGTEISGDYVSTTPRTEIVTGLRDVFAFEFFEQDMVGVKGYDAAILEALKRHNVRIVSKTSNANTITHYLAGPLKAVKRAAAQLEENYPTAVVTARKVSIISVIGSDLRVAGLTKTAVVALTDGGVEILGLHQLMRNVDVQFVIQEDDFERAITLLHAQLIEKADVRDGARTIGRQAA
ncbi:MAG: aspartate kinase [Parvularculaceae bacterium]